MEYKLNKIDTSLRQRINDETKDGVIHRKTEIKINNPVSDKEEKGKSQKRYKKSKEEDFNVEKYAGKKDHIAVEAVKVENINIQAEKEEKYASDCKGQFIDIRK